VILCALAVLASALAIGGAPSVHADSMHHVARRSEPVAKDHTALLGDDGGDEATTSAGLGPQMAGLLESRLTYLLPLLFLLFLRRGNSYSGMAGRDQGWWTYWAFWIAIPVVIALVTSHPAVLILVAVGLLGRRWLPDPFLIVARFNLAQRLRRDVAANPANRVAHRQLAQLYLERRRPALALPHIEKALAGEPESAELLHLRGLALHLARRDAEAVEAFIAAVQRDPKQGYGDPFLRAGDALVRLQRWEDAEEAFERFLEVASSSVEGWFKLALVRKRLGKIAEAEKARTEGVQLYASLPGYVRRAQRLWYWRARLKIGL
jgi:tetratricopeptide (TPR) repeat protein